MESIVPETWLSDKVGGRAVIANYRSLQIASARVYGCNCIVMLQCVAQLQKAQFKIAILLESVLE